MKQQARFIFALGALTFLAGCATSGGSGASDSTSGAGLAYLDGVTYLSANQASSDRCLSNPSQAKGKTWKDLVRSANGCVKAGDWKNLDMVAQEIARLELNSPWGAYFYSVAAEHQGDLPRALWMVDLALKKTPNAGLFRYQKGRVLWKLDDHKLAIQEMAAAVKREPKLTDAHVFLAQAYHRDQHLDRATTHYEAALAQQSRNRICLEGLGDIRVHDGKYEAAVRLYDDAVSQASDDLNLRLKLAMAHEAIPANVELALSTYRAARDLAGRGKGTASVDLNEKIKTLEASVAQNKASKQAKLDGKAQSADKRAPSAAPAKGAAK